MLLLPPQPEVLDPDPLPGAGTGGAFVPGRAPLVEFLVRGEIWRRLERWRAPGGGAETLTPEQIRLETLALGFRTREGVSLATLREQPGADAMVAALTRAGLVRVDRGRVIATTSGLVVADQLPLSFVDGVGD